MPTRFRPNKVKLLVLSLFLVSALGITSPSLAQSATLAHLGAVTSNDDASSTQSDDVQAPDGTSDRTGLTAESVPGSRDGTAPRLATSAAEASVAASATALAPVANVTGRVNLSVDGLGTNQASGVIQVSKASGATVRQAWMFAAGTSTAGYTPVDGDITLDGQAVSWDPSHTIPNAIGSGNVAADVTSLVKQKIDAAPAGRVDITVTEANPNNIDGEILAVIFDDPAVSTNSSVTLLYGAQQPLGDSFTANFTGPIDTNNPNLRVRLGLGISFGYQPSAQYSTIDVNGTELTSTAGGQDDCNEPDLVTCDNGALLTVGGLDDDPGNPPDPTCATGATARCDDELYDLLPLLPNEATNVTVNSNNATSDDNLFFASLETSNTTAPPPPPAKTYTALGDSYSAGEGLYPYLSGTDDAWLNLDPPRSNRCHRSNDAYGPRLAADRNLGDPTFVACSGAITNDYFESNSEGNYRSDGTPEPAQRSALSDATKTVTLTFGGNDVGFADVLKACVYDEHKKYGQPGCSRNSSLRERVEGAIKALAGGPARTTANGKPIHPLTEVLNDILSQAKNARIYIADYPQLFGNVDALKSKACRVGTIEVSGSVFIQGDGVFIAKDDVRWLNQMGAKLNRTIQSAVATLANPRITYVPVGPSFSGHRLCDRRTSWIHELSGLVVVSGIFHVESFSVASGSFHPTDDGQKAYETAFGSNLSSS